MPPAEGVPDPPGHLSDLIQRLLSRGFTEVHSEYDADSFGNVQRVFERAPVRVRVTKDRGDWSAELTAEGWPRHDHFGDDWVFLPPSVTDE